MKRSVNFRFSGLAGPCAAVVMMCIVASPTGARAQVPAHANANANALATASATLAPAAQSILASDPTSHGADDAPHGTGLASDDLGKTTIDLLALQVSGRVAAPGLPIPGDQETASYKRYLETFSKPIPDFFTNTIKPNSGS